MRADRILDGLLTWYSRHEYQVGFPPPWFHDPWAVKQLASQDRHWSRLDEFAGGDVKAIWEHARFGFVFPFVRAFALTGHPRYVEAFWRAFESWRNSNPPQSGIHWKCGQEVALRLMALVFGFLVFRNAPQTTMERESLLAEVLDVSARRIEVNLSYALSQKNNHGVSEAAGLFTAGVMLDRPEWTMRASRTLDQLAGKLIYDDGSFSQHSTNYHRLMLHAYLWAIRLGEATGQPLSDRVVDRVARAGKWLLGLLDSRSGRCFNLGSNDGAHFLDLTDLGYLDYRPTVQAVGAVVDRSAWLPSGPWDELARWLGCDFSTTSESGVRQGHQYFSDGGYAVFRHAGSVALFRCPQRFQHRPAQCDLLHFDLMHRGINLLRDGGSYSYNCEREWQKYFSGTAAHNTVQFDDQDQMPKLSRFLFGQWPSLKVENRLSNETPTLAAEFVDWRGCRHRRTVTTTGSGFRIVDRIQGYRQNAVLRWRLAPDRKWMIQDGECWSEDCTIRVTASPGPVSCELTTGWESLHYLERTELPVLQALVTGDSQELTTEIVLR